jgi:hypothetical protein
MNEHPTIPNRADFALTLWLIAETNTRGYLVEPVATNTCLAKRWRRDVGTRSRLLKIVTLAELKSRHEHQYAEELQ